MPRAAIAEDDGIDQRSAPLREALEASRIRAVDPTAGTKLMRDVPYWA